MKTLETQKDKRIEETLLTMALDEIGTDYEQTKKIITAPEDYFFFPNSKKVLKAMKYLQGEGKIITAVNVEQQINRLDSITQEELFTIFQTGLDNCHLTEVDSALEILEGLAIRRRLLRFSQEVAQLSLDKTIKESTLLQEVESKMLLLTKNKGEQPYKLKTMAEGLLDFANLLEEGKNQITETGLLDLDAVIGGVKPGELIIIGARPSMGKTYLAMILAEAIARQGKPILFCSAEMSGNQLSLRYALKRSFELGTPLSQEELTGKKPITQKEADILATIVADYSELNFYFTDKPGGLLKINDINQYLHEIHRQHGEIGLVVVDYIQLVADQNSPQMHLEIGKWTKALKRIASEFNTCVMSLAQLNRGVENRNDKRPVMPDLKASGAMGEDSDIVLLLYRNDYYYPDNKDNTLDIIVAKNRNGPRDVTVKTLFYPEAGRILNKARTG